jgi:hypothetical protein
MGRVHYGAQIIRTAFRAGRLETRDFKEIISAQSAEPECGYPPLSPGSWSQLRACSAKGKPNDCRGAAAPHTASRFHPSLTVSLGGVLASFTSCRRASSASELGVSCIHTTASRDRIQRGLLEAESDRVRLGRLTLLPVVLCKLPREGRE